MRIALFALVLAIAGFCGVAWSAWDMTGPAGLLWLGCAPVAAAAAPALGIKSLDWLPYRRRRP